MTGERGEGRPGQPVQEIQRAGGGDAEKLREQPRAESSKEAALRDIDDRIGKIDAEIAISENRIPPLRQERLRFTTGVDSLQEQQRGEKNLSAGEQERLRLLQDKIDGLRRQQRDEESYIRELEERKEQLLALRRNIESWKQ